MHVEQLESKEAQQEMYHKTRLAQQAAAAESATAGLELQLAACREQTNSTQQQVDSLQSQLDHTRTQLQSAQQQNSRLLTDVVAAQREAGELSKQKKLAQTELRQLQQQVSEASRVSLEVQHQLQATQAEHARLVADLRYAFCLYLSKFGPTVCAATLLCCMHAAALKLLLFSHSHLSQTHLCQRAYKQWQRRLSSAAVSLEFTQFHYQVQNQGAL